MATFYRRVQVNSVIWGIRVTLMDLAVSIFVGVGAGLAAGKVLGLYELDFIGSSFVPSVVGFGIFYFLCSWFRLEGDGVIRKDGRFRFLASRKINRILIPDRAGAEELFVVVYGRGGGNKGSFLTRFWKGFVYGMGLEKRPLGAGRVFGSGFCTNLKRKER